MRDNDTGTLGQEICDHIAEAKECFRRAVSAARGERNQNRTVLCERHGGERCGECQKERER